MKTFKHVAQLIKMNSPKFRSKNFIFFQHSKRELWNITKISVSNHVKLSHAYLTAVNEWTVIKKNLKSNSRSKLKHLIH